MDMCVRKPLVATCSTDKTVRLWNYNDRTCELVKAFADEIYSIATRNTPDRPSHVAHSTYELRWGVI